MHLGGVLFFQWSRLAWPWPMRYIELIPTFYRFELFSGTTRMLCEIISSAFLTPRWDQGRLPDLLGCRAKLVLKSPATFRSVQRTVDLLGLLRRTRTLAWATTPSLTNRTCGTVITHILVLMSAASAWLIAYRSCPSLVQRFAMSSLDG